MAKGKAAAKAAKPVAAKAAAGSAVDAAAAALAGAAAPGVDAAGADKAATVAHQIVSPKDLTGLKPVPDTVSQVVGPIATAAPVEDSEPLTYQVLERSFIPKKPGQPAELVEAGEIIVYAGKAGSNLKLLTPPAADEGEDAA